MSSTQILRKMKSEGLLGNFVRVRRDGTVLIRSDKTAHQNGNVLQAMVRAYVKEWGICVK